MKRRVRFIIMLGTCIFFSVQKSEAQIPIIQIIKEGIKKVIKAADLQVQRIQTRTIWLQNAQKVVENKMSELKLTEITGWADKQKKIYQDYFDELSKVKQVLSGYSAVKDIINKQKQIVFEYKQAYTIFKSDKHFTSDETDYMYQVYTGILNESLNNLDQLYLVVNCLMTQMSDGKRLEIISRVGANIDSNLSDLREFNAQAKTIGLQRAREKNDIDQISKLYGLTN